MAFNAGAIQATLGFRVDDDGAQRFERKLKTLRGDTAKPVTAELRGDLNRRDLDLYERKLKDLRGQVSRREAFKAQLGADYDSRAMRAFERDTRQVVRATDDNVRAQGRLRTAFGNVYGSGGALFAAAGGIYAFQAAGKAVIGTASDINESLTKNQTLFGQSADAIDRWSKRTATSLGISRKEALASAGSFGSLFETIGLADKPASDMSQRLVTLAADLASFNNASPAEALEALRSGLIGEAEPMRRFGALLSETRVKQEAYKAGIAETGAELTEQQKVQARYQLILKDTDQATGDFRKTSGGLANQIRILKARLTDVAGEIGAKLLPHVVKAANWLNRFITEFQRGVGAGGRFREILEDVGREAERTFKVIKAVAGFLADHTFLIKAAAAGWVAYKVAALGAAAASKAAGLAALLAGRRAAGGAAVGGAGGALAGGGALGTAGRAASRAPLGIGLAIGAGVGFEAFVKSKSASVLDKEIQGLVSDRNVKGLEKLYNSVDRLSKLPGGLEKARAAIRRGSAAIDELNRKDLAKAEKEMRENLRAMTRDLRNNWRLMEGYTDVSLKDIRRNVASNTSLIKQRLGDDTAEGREAVRRNFKLAADAIRKQMRRGEVDTREGAREIRRLMVAGLKALGLTQGQAEGKLDTGTIQEPGSRVPGGGGRRAGGGWIGAPGMVGQDTVPALLAPGEAVLNRHQQAVIEGMLGGGFLDRLFARVQTPHFMAKGGIVPVPGFPGESAASSVVGKILQIARTFGLVLTDAFGPGHRSPGHTVYGTAADFAGPDASMDRAVKALVGQGFVVGYDGRYGSQDWPGHGPAAGQGGSNAHLHVELGGKVLAALVEKIKAPRSGLRGGLGALVQRGLDISARAATQRVQDAVSMPAPGGSGVGAVGGSSNRALGRGLLGAFGFARNQFPPLDRLWTGESGWNERARNPSSGAYGIPQALPASKMASAGSDWMTNAGTQIKWGLGYIKQRYGTPAAAYAAWLGRSPHWYRRGGRVQRFDKGGRAGGPAQGFTLKGARHQQTDRIGEFERIVSQIETLRGDYSHQEGLYNRISEDDWIDPETGAVNVSVWQGQIRRMFGMVHLARLIRDKLLEARRIARRITRTYRRMVDTLRDSVTHAKRKDRAGIRSNIRGLEGKWGEWRGTVHGLDQDVENAGFDLTDVGDEYKALLKLGETGRPPEATPGDDGAAGDTGPSTDQQAVLDQIAAQLRSTQQNYAALQANFKAFTGPGDLGSGQGSSAYGSALIDAGAGTVVGGTSAYPFPGGFSSSPTGDRGHVPGQTPPIIVQHISLASFVPPTGLDLMRLGDVAVDGIKQRPYRPVTGATVG